MHQHFTALKSILKSTTSTLPLVDAFLADLLTQPALLNDQVVPLQSLLTSLKSLWVTPSRRSSNEEVALWFEGLFREREFLSRSQKVQDGHVFGRLSYLADKVAVLAMATTREVVEVQNLQRKAFLASVKRAAASAFNSRTCWSNLIGSLTHEWGPWYFPDRMANNWELDPTEGPDRIRRRLRRVHLKIEDRFYTPTGRRIRGPADPPNILNYLFEREEFERDSASLIERLHTTERISMTCPVTLVTQAEEFPGELLLGSTCVYFVGQERDSSSSFIDSGGSRGSLVLTKVWPLDEMQEVTKCRYQLQNIGIELFLNNGMTQLLAFATPSAAEEFHSALLSSPLINLVEERSLAAMTQKWRDRLLTNFEYLTFLNKLSGRSTSDLMQYPVFPFILADYTSNQLDLTVAESFRNLSRPMAVQKRSRENYFVHQYNYLKVEKESEREETLPYHYGSHYSNSGIVLHFLVRLPPFTQMFLKYQDNQFDIPDRTFHSMETTWALASGQSSTDFKEMISEFFFLPEFLMNGAGFDLGIRQSGQRVDAVRLPSWARGDPRLFILVHRQALESEMVSRNLHNWIDLIFGWKQVGKPAVEALNVFHPATYFGVDASKVEDPLRRTALQTMIRTFGQTPRQIFTIPHPTQTPPVPSPPRPEPVRVLKGVRGLSWGTFAGSPSQPPPVVIWRRSPSASSTKVATLIPLATNDAFGLPADTCLFLSYSRNNGGPLVNATFVASVAVVSWGHADSLIRIRFQKNQPPLALLSPNSSLDELTICASDHESGILFVGYKSGSIAIFAFHQPIKVSHLKCLC